MIEALIRRRVTTAMLYLGICLLGVISLDRLPVQLLPSIEFPKLTVITPYENALPSEIETLVTRYVEEAVSAVNGVVSVQSESLEGLSLVTASFQWGTNMDLALVETKEKVDLAKGELPQDAGMSMVVKFDPRAEPVMIYSIVNKGGDFRQVRRRIERELVPYLERVEGVALVEAGGGFRRQINIDLDVAKIYSHSLSLAEVMERLASENQSFPAGYLERGSVEYLVRAAGEFRELDEIRDVAVGRNEAGVPVYLHQVGTVEDSFRDRKSIVRSDGGEAVALYIHKEPGKNTVATCARVDEEMTRIREKYRKDFTIRRIYDQSEFIQNSVDNVFSEAIMGALIAFLVLYVFLGELRAPVIIATAIPISILGTFGLMYFKGISLNTMSLGGLALAIGMMTDSGIVVLESIAQKRAESKGKDPVRPAIDGTNEVMLANIASNVASVVVFLPIVFLSGLSGALFAELALTITFTQIFSTLGSVTLIPMLATLSVPVPARLRSFLTRGASLQTRIHNWGDGVMVRAEELYVRVIELALSRKRQVLAGGVACMLLGLLLFPLLKAELMPPVDPGEFTVELSLPQGTTLEETAMASARVEGYFRTQPYVQGVFAKVGSDPEESITEQTSGRRCNSALVKVLLVKSRRPHVREIVRRFRNEVPFGDRVRADVVLKESVIESVVARRRKPVHVEVYGAEFSMLTAIGNEVKRSLAGISGVTGIAALFDRGEPELKVEIDRNRLASLGVSVSHLAATIRAALHGEVATRFRDRDEEIDMRVRLQKADRTGSESLYKIMVKSESGGVIPVSQFATVTEGTSTSKIIRSEQSRVNVVTADVAGNADTVLDRVRAALSRLRLPEGYEVKMIGELDEAVKVLGEMRFALVLAIVLIYMVLAAQFQSLKSPLIVMLSIPVASLGISGALLVTGKSLNINSGIGIVLVAGIVVNNAIVLFDYIRLEQGRGLSIHDAIVSAGRRRLRPILMTSLVSVCALLPVAVGIGEGSELQQPMAMAVLGGITVSTFLTLVFIPTVYSLVYRERER
ncbi:MAG: efflux RND transporter permease subunit [Spirochaetes bacterium]|nr:efflux RND transporter permease subunit [Spirochaetota bacterium]